MREGLSRLTQSRSIPQMKQWARHREIVGQHRKPERSRRSIRQSPECIHFQCRCERPFAFGLSHLLGFQGLVGREKQKIAALHRADIRTGKVARLDLPRDRPPAVIE